MKKATIIVLIAFVLAILAGVIFFLYSGANDITYVCDYQDTLNSTYSSALVLKRLYSSNIDEEKMEDFSSTLITTEFTEDELLTAALKAGKPEFYPWFSYQTKKPMNSDNIILEGKMGQTLFENQTSTKYTVSNLRMELACEDLEIDGDNTVIYGTEPPLADVKKTVPVISEDYTTMAAFIDKIGSYNVCFNGTSGTIMVQYTYDVIAANGVISRNILEDQLLQLYITVSTAEDGSLTVGYEIVEGNQVSDIY